MHTAIDGSHVQEIFSISIFVQEDFLAYVANH